MSIKKMMEMNAYNAATQQWEPYSPKTDAAAVATKDGSNVQSKIDAVPSLINTAVAEVRGGVSEEGNTLAKLHDLVAGIQSLLNSDDVDLDTVQELVDFIKNNRNDIDAIGTNKVNFNDIINSLDTVGTVSNKVLDARQGKVLKDLIDSLTGAINTLQTQANDFATKNEMNNAVEAARPVISDTAPQNPTNGQLWFKPSGTIEV